MPSSLPSDMELTELILVFNLLWTSDTFNLDASHPIIYEATEGSYFGMSVAIRPKAASLDDTWIIQVGAPRGGRGPGTAYRCAFRGPCQMFPLDEESDPVGGQGVREFREKKESAWIGVAMDIARFGSHERTVVCGHRWMNQNLKNPENIDVTYLVTGACYLENIISNLSKTPVQRLLPLVDKDKIYTPKPYVVDLSTYHWGLGQAGISVRLTEQSEHLLIGAPGVTHWIGSVIRYDGNSDPIVGNFARSEMARRSRYPYLGYSVSFGRFYKDGEVWFVAGAPRSANYRGEVFTFQFKGSGDVSVRSSFVGATFGEYFGSALASADLNGDGFDDLIVGAPLFSKLDPDEGRIYVYSGKGDFLAPGQVVNGAVGQGRFGTCVVSLGDLDQDGYDDVAVGAPYEDEGKGALYVFRGFSKGLRTEFSQRVRARDVHPHLRGFGVSISTPVDVDGNKYLDIAVGSYLSDRVVLIRSRPVVSLHPAIRTENVSLIDRREPYLNVTVCLRFAGSNAPDYVDVLRTMTVDPLYGRGMLDPKVSSYRKSIRLRANQIICEVHSILLNTSQNFSPIQIAVKTELTSCSRGKGRSLLIGSEQTKQTDDFPKNCPMGEKAEASKEISFAGVCGPDHSCVSDLEISCHVPEFRDGSYTLGSTEFLLLSVNVKNLGEPAYETRMKIRSNLKLKRREDAAASETSGKTFWLDREGILTDTHTANFSFRLDLDEALAEYDGLIYLNLSVEIFTTSMEINVGNNNCKISAKLLTEAVLDFHAYSSISSADVKESALQGRTLNVTHYYEVEKTGVTPVKDARLKIRVPVLFERESLLTFEMETAEWMHFSRDDQGSALADGDDEEETVPMVTSAPPTNRTLFLNCSTTEVSCDVFDVFFATEIPSGFSSYVKILILINVSAVDSVKMGKNIVHLSTTGTLTFSKYLEEGSREIRKTASISLYGEERTPGVETRVVALSILAGGFLLFLIVTGLARSDFFKRSKKRELEALKDADACFVYFATGGGGGGGGGAAASPRSTSA